MNSLLERLEQKWNKDRTEIIQAEQNLKDDKRNVTEIGATERAS